MCTSPANRRLNVEVYVLTILMPHLGLGFSPWWASLMWMNMCEVLSPNLSYRPADSPPGRHGGQWSQRGCKVTLPKGCFYAEAASLSHPSAHSISPGLSPG